MVVLMPTRETVDICAYFFKLNKVICGPSCTIFSELKHIIPLLPFPQHIEGLFKKRTKTTSATFQGRIIYPFVVS